MDNSNSLIEYDIIEKLKFAVKVKQVNQELAEQLRSSLQWLLYYSKKHEFELPEKDKILNLINRSIEIENKLPIIKQKSTPHQPIINTKNSTEDETEP